MLINLSRVGEAVDDMDSSSERRPRLSGRGIGEMITLAPDAIYIAFQSNPICSRYVISTTGVSMLVYDMSWVHDFIVFYVYW